MYWMFVEIFESTLKHTYTHSKIDWIVVCISDILLCENYPLLFFNTIVNIWDNISLACCWNKIRNIQILASYSDLTLVKTVITRLIKAELALFPADTANHPPPPPPGKVYFWSSAKEVSRKLEEYFNSIDTDTESFFPSIQSTKLFQNFCVV